MAKPDQIQANELRRLMEDAHRAMREGDPNTAVRCSADAFLALAARHPSVLTVPPAMPVHPFPRLGANLMLAQGEPASVEFHREDFSLSEAITYYEYTLSAILRAERRAAEAGAGPAPLT